MKSVDSNGLYRLVLRVMNTVIVGVLFVVMTACGQTSGNNNLQVDSGTLPGEDEIYPTIMVDGDLYEWRKGRAIVETDEEAFINSMDYYGDIIKVDKRTPENNCEIVCVFDVAGAIYTDSNDKDVVYLKLNTEWLDDKTVIFDRVK